MKLKIAKINNKARVEELKFLYSAATGCGNAVPNDYITIIGPTA